MNKALLLGVGLWLGACSTQASTEDDSRNESGAHALSGWAIGDYVAPEYVNGTGPDLPAMGIAFDTDGTWAHTSNGVIDDSGRWSYSTNELVLDGAELTRSKNCAILLYESRKYHRADELIPGCPDTIAPLTEEESCLLGEFEVQNQGNAAGSLFNWKRNRNRLQVFEQVYSGDDDAHYTEVQSWSIQNGELCYEGSSCSPIDWAEVESSRLSVRDPACALPG